MGAAVIWSHLELYGDVRVSKAVFVDQAPLQVRHRRNRKCHVLLGGTAGACAQSRWRRRILPLERLPGMTFDCGPHHSTVLPLSYMQD